MIFDQLLNEKITKECRACHGDPHCGTCHGEGVITVSRYELLTDQQRVEVLELEVLRLRPDLQGIYPRKPCSILP